MKAKNVFRAFKRPNLMPIVLIHLRKALELVDWANLRAKGNTAIFLVNEEEMKNSATMTNLNRDRIYCNTHENGNKMYINTVVMV